MQFSQLSDKLVNQVAVLINQILEQPVSQQVSSDPSTESVNHTDSRGQPLLPETTQAVTLRETKY